MILHREHRPPTKSNSAITPIKKGNVRFLDALGKAFSFNRKPVIHRGDFDLAGGVIHDRMIGSVMAVRHLDRAPPKSQPKKLMTEANSKDRQAGLDHAADNGNGILACRGRIAWPIR